MTFSTPSVENRVVSWRLLVHHVLGRYRRRRARAPITRPAAPGLRRAAGPPAGPAGRLRPADQAREGAPGGARPARLGGREAPVEQA